jgi:hypothetical protein
MQHFFYKNLFINGHSETCTKNEEADFVSPRVKQPKHEADHEPPTSAEVKNGVSRRQGMVLIKYREDFTIPTIIIVQIINFFRCSDLVKQTKNLSLMSRT